MPKTVQNVIAILIEDSWSGLHAFSFRKDGSFMSNFVENCRLGLRCLDAPVTLPGLYMYFLQSQADAYLFSWYEVQMLFSKFTISMCIVSKLANTTEEY